MESMSRSPTRRLHLRQQYRGGSRHQTRWEVQREGNDSHTSILVGGRSTRPESERSEGHNGGLDGRGCRSVEKGWLLEDCRCAQLEAEAETCNTRSQGRQPLHEGALCLQSETS